jgi:hypothetical protein
MESVQIKDVPYEDLEKQWAGMLHRFVWRIEGIDPEDILQELRVVLMNAQQRFDPAKGVAFSTYLWRACKNRVGKLRHQTLNVKKRIPPTQQVVFCDMEHSDTMYTEIRYCSICRQLPVEIDSTEMFDLLFGTSKDVRVLANLIVGGYRTRKTWEEYGLTSEQIKSGMAGLRTLLRKQKEV